jgi:hypothetical protein
MLSGATPSRRKIVVGAHSTDQTSSPPCAFATATLTTACGFVNRNSLTTPEIDVVFSTS